MPGRLVEVRSTLGKLKARAGANREVRVAQRQSKHFCDTHPRETCICWDLDNTLVDSGVLLGAGCSLDQAIVAAHPVANMLEFYEVMQTHLPGAANFILSARSGSMRDATLDWFSRHGLVATSLCLVPHAAAKPRIWRQLASNAPLVIVDDLSFGHESDVPSLYHDLILRAEATALSYVGFEQIAEISVDREAVTSVATQVVGALSRRTQPLTTPASTVRPTS